MSADPTSDIHKDTDQVREYTVSIYLACLRLAGDGYSDQREEDAHEATQAALVSLGFDPRRAAELVADASRG